MAAPGPASAASAFFATDSLPLTRVAELCAPSDAEALSLVCRTSRRAALATRTFLWLDEDYLADLNLSPSWQVPQILDRAIAILPRLRAVSFGLCARALSPEVVAALGCGPMLSALSGVYLDELSAPTGGVLSRMAGSLTSLRIECNSIDMDGAAALSSLSRLTSLMLECRSVAPAAGAVLLSGATSVHKLWLDGGSWVECALEHMRPTLQSVRLKGEKRPHAPPAAGGGIANALLTQPALDSMGLEGYDFRAAAVKSLARHTNLVTLEMWNCSVEECTPLSALVSLKMLQCGGVAFHGAPAARMLAHLTAVTRLSLGTCGNASPRHTVYACASSMQRLEDLCLYANDGDGVDAESARALAAALPRLRRLVLAGCGIGGEGAEALSNLTQLEELDLARNHLGGEGTAHLTRLTAVTTLTLEDNAITGVPAFEALAQMTQLRELLVGNNPGFNDAAAHAIARLPCLTCLVVSGANVQSAGRAVLAAAVKDPEGIMYV